VVLCLLRAFGIVSSKKLSHWRLKAYFITVAVSLIITTRRTPSPQSFLSVALILLYELSVLIIRHALRR
jgi:Sec-independent protein secretion pathway component TatC